MQHDIENLEPSEESAEPTPETVNPLEDTDRIQQAIEKVVDEETAAIPPLPLSGIPEIDGGSQAGVLPRKVGTHAWFFTFMCMKIPIVSWFYLCYLAFNKKKTDRREFARAYLFYKLVFLSVSLVILGILLYIGIGLLDQLLAYMEML